MITLCGFGVSNGHNKLKLALLEKQIPFSERLVYPCERDEFAGNSSARTICTQRESRSTINAFAVVGDDGLEPPTLSV